jgi:hypothetical protein
MHAEVVPGAARANIARMQASQGTVAVVKVRIAAPPQVIPVLRYHWTRAMLRAFCRAGAAERGAVGRCPRAFCEVSATSAGLRRKQLESAVRRVPRGLRPFEKQPLKRRAVATRVCACVCVCARAHVHACVFHIRGSQSVHVRDVMHARVPDTMPAL